MTKPSQLPKDGHFSGRINKKIKALLKKKRIGAQEIIDAYVDSLLKVDTNIKWKRGPK